MRYELEHPRLIKVTIRQRERKSYNKIGEIRITPARVDWKSGAKGASKRHYVAMDEFIKWMSAKPSR
jgi:hypothetical protein